jgi:hypothetical protein
MPGFKEIDASPAAMGYDPPATSPAMETESTNAVCLPWHKPEVRRLEVALDTASAKAESGADKLSMDTTF